MNFKIYITAIFLCSLYSVNHLHGSVNIKNLHSLKSISKEIITSSKKQKRTKHYKKYNSRVQRKIVKKKNKLTFTPINKKPSFDVPVTYNSKVKKWIRYFQGRGKNWFESRLGRSHTYLPMMQSVLSERGLPKDLAYIAMIESGFSSGATSHAQAVGYWQFIKRTANQYGLRTNWWIDERRDFKKSTLAATSYLSDLYKSLGSWYLTASAYNMGETRLRGLMKKYRTKNFWVLSQFRDFPRETRDYIPKLIATMLIAKSPKLYGFYNVKPKKPYAFDTMYITGGTDLVSLYSRLGIKPSSIKKLNPELKHNFIPKHIRKHRIRIPKGFLARAKKFKVKI